MNVTIDFRRRLPLGYLSLDQLGLLTRDLKRDILDPLEDVEDTLVVAYDSLIEGCTEPLSVAAVLKLVGSFITNVHTNLAVMLGLDGDCRVEDLEAKVVQAGTLAYIIRNDNFLRKYINTDRGEKDKKLRDEYDAARAKPLDDAGKELNALTTCPGPISYRFGHSAKANASKVETEPETTTA